MESDGSRIVSRILLDAKSYAESKIDNAKKLAEAMIDEQRESGHQKASERVSSILQNAKTESELIRVTMLGDVKRKADWSVLSEKDRLIATVMSKTKSRLLELAKSQKYLPLLEGLIVQAGTALGGGNMQVALNEHDSKLSLKLDKLAKEIEGKTGTSTRLDLAKKKLDGLGGVIVRTPDEGIIADNTFETILRRREIDLKPKIAKALFEE
jgi:vacuolar-type H+-ATPase subunit E/Vma4